MIVEDWRDVDAGVIEALIDEDVRRWEEDLAWDSRPAWAIVEEGRRRGGVPGWILHEPGGPALAWAYYILHDGELQIGGLSARRSTDLRAVLDRVLASPEAGLAASISGFVFPATDALVSAMQRRRFAVRRSFYLSKTLSLPGDPATLPADGARLRAFEPRDVVAAARLMATAYAGSPGAACFAPHGRLDEWVRYVRQLLETPACGAWMPEASFVIEQGSPRAVTALILATRIAPGTAHVAQVVVGAERRGTGTGALLIARAESAAAAAGAARMTLMVDEGNAPARRLYGSLGYGEQTAFAHARRKGRVRPILAD